jgi:anti-anti-sigma regulatory factor
MWYAELHSRHEATDHPDQPAVITVPTGPQPRRPYSTGCWRASPAAGWGARQVPALGPRRPTVAGRLGVLAARSPGIARPGHGRASGVVFLVRTGELAAGSSPRLAAGAGRRSHGGHGSAYQGTPWTGRRRAGELDGRSRECRAPAGCERAIIVDLAGMELIDSGGMAALVLARPAGGGLFLAAPHEQVMRLPPRTRLIDVSQSMPASNRQPAAPVR